MSYVPTYTRERRRYSDTLYPNSFNLDSLPALTISAQRKTYGWCFTSSPMVCVAFSCDCMFWDERGGGLTRQPMDPKVDTETITTVLSTNRLGSRSFSSRCWTFRRTHRSTDPIRLLCTRLALPLTLSLPSGFALSARLMILLRIVSKILEPREDKGDKSAVTPFDSRNRVIRTKRGLSTPKPTPY